LTLVLLAEGANCGEAQARTRAQRLSRC